MVLSKRRSPESVNSSRAASPVRVFCPSSSLCWRRNQQQVMGLLFAAAMIDSCASASRSTGAGMKDVRVGLKLRQFQKTINEFAQVSACLADRAQKILALIQRQALVVAQQGGRISLNRRQGTTKFMANRRQEFRRKRISCFWFLLHLFFLFHIK